MSKLMSAYFSRLFTWTIFRVLIALMAAGGILAAVILRNEAMVWNAPYMIAYLMFPHYIGIIIGLFNYPLFTNGTIRNQLSVGHDRCAVFFADWAASNLFAVVLYLILAGCMLGIPMLLGNTKELAGSTASMGSIMMEDMVENVSEVLPVASNVSGKAVAWGLVFSCLHIVLFSTITQLFCVLLKGVKSFLAIYLGNQALILLGVGASVLALRGNLPEKMLALFPTAACMRLSSFEIDSLTLPGTAVAAVETAVVFFIGMLYFRKTDLT